MNKVIIGLGSNIAPQENMVKAVNALKGQFSILKVSKIITTKPIGFLEQDDFLNATVLMETPLDQVELIKALKAIEDTLGRNRSNPKFGPRTIDLDIIIWNGDIIDPDFYERDFLQTLVLEICPELKTQSKTKR